MKRCSVCGELLPDCDYSVTHHGHLQAACKKCRLYQRHQREAKRGEISTLLHNWGIVDDAGDEA